MKNKTGTISVRLKPDELKTIEEKAESAGMNRNKHKRKRNTLPRFIKSPYICIQFAYLDIFYETDKIILPFHGNNPAFAALCTRTGRHHKQDKQLWKFRQMVRKGNRGIRHHRRADKISV